MADASRRTRSPRRIVVLVILAHAIAGAVHAHAASLKLEWDPPPGEGPAGYLVSYGLEAGRYTDQIDVGAVTSYRVLGLAANTRYCFAIQAYDRRGLLSSHSVEACGAAVEAGGDLQSILDAAGPGDAILLQAGATFEGNFELPSRPPSERFITLRSSAPDVLLPGEGARIAPGDAAYLPKLRSPNSQPVLSTEPGAHHYRLQFLELLGNGGTGAILALGDGTSAQNALDLVPHDLIVDRVYIHGNSTLGHAQGIALHSASTRIVNSYISDIKSATTKAQAIVGWNGPGPYVIVNNYLQSAGQNVLLGSRAPSIPGLVPSDITIRKNRFTRKVAWRGEPWVVGSLLEVRNARQVAVDGNTFENYWATRSLDTAVVFSSANTTLNQWSRVEDLQFTNNTVRNVAAGISILRDGSPALDPVTRVVVSNNLLARISSATYGGAGYFLVVNGVADLIVDHNTVVSDGKTAVRAIALPSARHVFTNNILVDRGAAITGASTADGTATIDTYFPGALFARSIQFGVDPALYPVLNYYPESLAAVGFVDFLGGDYRLATTSAFKLGGMDGKDPGYDYTRLKAAQR